VVEAHIAHRIGKRRLRNRRRVRKTRGWGKEKKGGDTIDAGRKGFSSLPTRPVGKKLKQYFVRRKVLIKARSVREMIRDFTGKRRAVRFPASKKEERGMRLPTRAARRGY